MDPWTGVYLLTRAPFFAGDEQDKFEQSECYTRNRGGRYG
jgi:hypothetical protein